MEIEKGEEYDPVYGFRNMGRGTIQNIARKALNLSRSGEKV